VLDPSPGNPPPPLKPGRPPLLPPGAAREGEPPDWPPPPLLLPLLAPRPSASPILLTMPPRKAIRDVVRAYAFY